MNIHSVVSLQRSGLNHRCILCGVSELLFCWLQGDYFFSSSEQVDTLPHCAHTVMARLRGTGTLPKVLFLNHFCPFLCAWQGKLIHVTCTIATRCILLHSGGLTGHFTWIQKSCICVYTPQLTSFTGQWIAAKTKPWPSVICSWCDWTVVDINQCDSYFSRRRDFLSTFCVCTETHYLPL